MPYISLHFTYMLQLFAVSMDRCCLFYLWWNYYYVIWWTCSPTSHTITSSSLLDNIRVTVIVWRLRWDIIRTALSWIVWHSVHSQQHTYISSSYRSNRLGSSHWDPYAMRRGGCLELYYYNTVEWFWLDSSLISTTNWFNRPRNDL